MTLTVIDTMMGISPTEDVQLHPVTADTDLDLVLTHHVDTDDRPSTSCQFK